jgi:hypothetical protein
MAQVQIQSTVLQFQLIIVHRLKGVSAMGLDMYLNRHVYCGKHTHNEDVKPPIIEVPGINPMKVKSIVEEAIYWRKANAIHRWFVWNVQDGLDNCGTYYVGRGQLQELLDTVTKVLQAHDEETAMNLLPPQEGFYFGSTNVDTWYWEDLERTKTNLDAILAMPEDEDHGDYYYHSSW